MIAHAYKAEFVNETLTTTAIEAWVNNWKIDQGKNVSTFCFSSSDTKLSHWIPFQRKDWICFKRENPLKISGLFCKKIVTLPALQLFHNQFYNLINECGVSRKRKSPV